MKRGLILLMGIFAAMPLNAQKKVLTFEEAVKIALANGVLLNTQKNNLELNQFQRTQSLAGLGPTVSVSAAVQRTNGNSFNPNSGEVINGTFDQLYSGINGNWNVFNGFSQVYRAKQQAKLVDAQSYFVNRTAQDAINTVSSQYLTVLLDGELLRIAIENHTALNELLQQVKEQVSAGSRSPVDEYNQDSQTRAAEIRALQAKIQQINDMALLTQTLLIDPTDSFEVAKPAWDVNTIAAESLDINQLIEVALVSRGDLLRAVKSEQAAKYGASASKATLLPTVSLFGQVYSTYNKAQGDPDTRPFDEQIKRNNLKKQYGLSLNIPIFGGGQALQLRSQYVQQKVLHLNSQINRKSIEVIVKSDVLRAYANFQLYKQTYAATIAQMAAAEVAFQLETERYNLGVTTFVDFANANRVFVQAQTDKASAEYRLVFQKILLDYAVGTLKPEDLQ